MNRLDLLELVWPLAPGGVLLFTGAFVTYALRGPSFEFPQSSAAALATLVAAIALGHLARLAASGVAWGIHAFTAVDLFVERPAGELLDELSPRRLSPELLAGVDAALRARCGMAVEAIAARDAWDVRERKARRLDEAVALARASGPGALPWLEARSDAARALCASLGLGSLALLFVAAHDALFSRSVAHAISSFTLVVLGVALLVAAAAAARRARSASRRLALEALLSLLGTGAPKAA